MARGYAAQHKILCQNLLPCISIIYSSVLWDSVKPLSKNRVAVFCQGFIRFVNYEMLSVEAIRRLTPLPLAEINFIKHTFFCSEGCNRVCLKAKSNGDKSETMRLVPERR